MAKHINIADKLDAAKPRLYISEDEVYEINDDKNAVLKVQEMLGNSEDELKEVDKVFKLLLGKEGYERLEANNKGVTTRLSQIRVLMIAIMAAISNEDYEVTEARFRGEAEADK